jgi:hypothetical protein
MSIAIQPLSEMPIWALMDLENVITKTYWWEGDVKNPRKMSEVTVQGFQRLNEDCIRCFFTMDWIIAGIRDDRFITFEYEIPLIKVI